MIILTQAKALFDFESGGPGELSFYTNELLTIVRQVKKVYLVLCDHSVVSVRSQMVESFQKNINNSAAKKAVTWNP